MGGFYADAEALDPVEPWARPSAAARLARLRPQLPLTVPDTAELVGSNNNDVWRVGDLYLRVAWRGDRGRLRREADLVTALRDVIPVPEIVAVGGDGALAWSVSRAACGQPLDQLCGVPPAGQARAVAAELASILRTLHQWRPPPAVAAMLIDRPGQDDRDPVAIVGADTVPLPMPRALALAGPLKAVPFVDGGLVDAALARMRELADADIGPAGAVIHGDVYLGNVLVDRGRIGALIDFEFARLAPADLELISLVRALDAERTLGIGRPPILEWLRQDYPGLFAAPDLDRRLWLYALAYSLRQAIFWPPDRPEHDGLDPTHPLRTLRRLIDAPLPIKI